jgi:hypothetical protein
MDLKSARFWRDFASACFWGALAGCLPYLIITVPVGFFYGVTSLFKGEWVGLSGVVLMLLPLIIAYPLTFAALCVFGLPIYALLSRRGAVQPVMFGMIGAVIGIGLFETYIGKWDWDGLRLAMSAASGGFSGYIWARAMARRIN